MYALVKDGHVVNVILADPDFIATFDHDYDFVIGCSSAVGVGFTWDDVNGFQPPMSSPNIEAAPTDTTTGA